ncbi:MAG: DUF423 domain-containing protein [Pseudomonadales bacterium]|nr:DUF423 domain-containing protein [Pseudomonadales bacterium]
MRLGQFLIAVGAIFGAAGVGLGAWGAHGLSSYLGHENTQSWDTAVLYQLIHAVMLVVLGILVDHKQLSSGVLQAAGPLMVVGVMCFSGSLYGLTLTGARWLGPITPVGGAAFIAAWVLLAVAALRWRG